MGWDIKPILAANVKECGYARQPVGQVDVSVAFGHACYRFITLDSVNVLESFQVHKREQKFC